MRCTAPSPPRQVREIWLSSEDTGAYGRDLGTSLPLLLRALVEVLPPGEWVGGWVGGWGMVTRAPGG